jgi:hypothetical protein
MFLVIPLVYQVLYGMGMGLSMLWSLSVAALTRESKIEC